MRLATLFFAFFLIRKSFQMVEFYEEKIPLVKQFACVNTAFKAYHKKHRNIRIFSRNSSGSVNSLIKVPFTLITEWDLLHAEISVDEGAVMIFLEGNTDQDFDGLKRLQGIIMVEPVLIVCITDLVCSSDKYMKKILEMVASPELHYVAVDARGVIDIYEHTTMAEGNCGLAQLLRLGHCSDESTAEKVFQRPVNFHKCPLRAVTWTCSPYLEICGSEESNELCGIEGSILQVVVDKVNATPTLLTAQSPDDVRRLVGNGNADLGFGGLDLRSFKGVSYSTPHMVVQATIVARHSTWTLNRSCGNILQPLQAKVWIGIGVVILSILILRRLVPYFRRIYALQLFGIFIGIPVPRQPRPLPSRIYLLSLLLFGFFCSQSYLTNLTKVLSTPQQKLIRTLNDLEQSALRVIGPADSRERFRIDYPRIYSDFQVQDYSKYYDNLLELQQRGRSNSAYYVEELDTRIADWKTVESIRDRFNWYSVAFVLPNASAILSTSNEVSLRIGESGILTVYGIFMPTKYNQSAEYDELASSGRAVVLNFEELKGVFVLFITGLAMSFFFFLFEIVTSLIREKV